MLYIEQPSSPGDYFTSVDSDLKVELTEKLFSLDTQETKTSCNQEVNKYSNCNINNAFIFNMKYVVLFNICICNI